MIRRAIAIAALALGLAACGGTATPPSPWWMTAPSIQFGFIKSLTPVGGGYKLRLDLHLLFGADKTGIQACIDNGYCKPGAGSLLDDTYETDLKFVVTDFVPAATPVELVGDSSTAPTVTAAELYALAHGHNPHHIPAMATGADALHEFGFYVEAKGGWTGPGFTPVLRMAQIYHP
ncbi:MAG TPA: hypothetical protein VII54_04200 [Gaiellaceae bacterium]